MLLKRILQKGACLLTLWLILGMCYTTLELLYRGVTYRPMLAVGGLAGLCVGELNEHPNKIADKMWPQCLIGTAITLVIELVSGCILNILLKMDVWNYGCDFCNFHGQICLKSAVMWFFLMPLAIWVDDFVRWKLYGRAEPAKSPVENYRQLFRGK